MTHPEEPVGPPAVPVQAGEVRRLSAVAFLDVVGYSTMMAENAERTHQSWIRVLNETIRPATALHFGRIVKSTGDGVLAEFASARTATSWARQIQDALSAAQNTLDPADPPIVARIAVHIDEVFATADDIHGAGVNIAARLQEYAEPGGIVLSDAVLPLVRDGLCRPVRDLGLLNLKNIPGAVHAHALDPVGPRRLIRQFRRETTLPTIAVLPFRNLARGATYDYFAEGIVEDIIVSLASLRELMVIARGSTIAASQQETDLRGIGRALGVRYVVTGTVRRNARGPMRLAVRLHDVQDGVDLWSDVAEGAPGKLFDMQDRIVAGLVAGIAPRIQSAELRNALRKRPESFTAYDYTLRALDRMHGMEREPFLQARDLLQQAQDEDGDFAMPVAWAARWHSLLIGQGWSTNPERDSAAALELAGRAIKLDGRNALALATSGHLHAYLFHDYDVALAYFDRALKCCPGSALSWTLSSGTLSYVGRGDDAVRHAEQAIRISPFDQTMYLHYTFLGLAHYTAGSLEEAVKWGRMALSENPNFTSNLRIFTAALAALGRRDEANGVAQRLLRLEPRFTLSDFARTLLPYRDAVLRTRYLDHLRTTTLPP